MPDLTLLREAVAILIVAATHLFAGRIERAAGRHLRSFLSFAGGIAVAYVFVALLPKMGHYTNLFLEENPGLPEFSRLRLYLFGLLGFLVYFAADRYRAQADGGRAAVFLHGTVFATYSALVGYLIAHAAETRVGYVPHIAVGLIMAVHLFAVDHQLHGWHGAAFERVLRFLFAGAVIVGWTTGLWLPLSPGAIGIWSSILAGGILVNVFSEEFPSGGGGDARAFLVGVVTVVLVAAIFFSSSSALH
jgi:hypothetical protein